VVVLSLANGCREDGARSGPATQVSTLISSGPASSALAAPGPPPPPVTTSKPAGTAPTEALESDCMSAAESMKNAKPHRNAEAPFADCAVGVFGHCDGKDGERGHLCSLPLDVARTQRARKRQSDACCYRMP
jgi:hypothetical protein